MDGVTTVRRYLDAMARGEWDALAECLTPDVERLGPYGDDYDGVDAYVPFLRATIEALDGYVMRVDRVVAAGDALVVAELSETVTMNGTRRETPEALVFDLAPDGRIARVAIFLRTSFTP
ncbi:MAG TPA: nuclear transport factor 2 family protein [Acidimicrobiia bacterium]|jgi:ketosteroid isomerase-like protein|nr:nuclear transport factor 2 family protein [Acidimicrobiia bacterium]